MAEWQPPNGGYGWVVVMSSFLIMLIFSQPICTFGLYLPVIVEYHQSTTALISIVGSLLLASGCFFAIIIGILTDLYGCRLVVIFGGVVMFVTAIVSSIFKYVVVLFICYGFLFGVALTCLMNGTVICIHGYFTTRRAFASSFGNLAISFGSFIWPPLTQYFINQYNWNGAMFILSAVYLNVILFGWLLKSTPLTEKRRSEAMEHSFVQLVRKSFRVDILRKSFVFYLSSNFFVAYGHMIPFVFLPLHAMSFGYSANMSSLLISVIGIIGLFSRPVLGYVGDFRRVNRTLMFGISAIATGISMIMIIFSTKFYQFIIITSMFAVCAAGYRSVNTSILVDILGVQNIARSMGFFLLVSGLGCVLSIPSSGKLYDAFGDTTAVFLVAGVGDIIGGVLALISYLFQRKDGKLKPPRNVDDVT